jgi:hypothetical protein
VDYDLRIMVFLTAAGWFLFAVWCFLLIPQWWLVGFRRLGQVAPRLPEPAVWPPVSIIVPARNEGPKIEAGLSSLMTLDYPDLEIIAIDDRSTDDTGPIMDRLAERDPRVRVIHIQELPEGWLGKNHAMHMGVRQSRGELLLFTDGDVIFSPETIRHAVRYLLGRKVDHLPLNPQLIGGGFWENALICYFGMMFFAGLNAWLIPTRCKSAYVGIGAFNLIRHTVYEAIGGHAAIRLDVLDDVHLGKLVKQNGYHQDLLLADDLVRVRWQDSLWGVVRGLEKNSFALAEYSLVKVIGITLAVLATHAIPYGGAIVFGFPDSLPFLATVALMHATLGYIGYRFRNQPAVTLVLPVCMFLLMFTLWRSAVLTLRRGGVRWRETFYPLDQLRAGQLR